MTASQTNLLLPHTVFCLALHCHDLASGWPVWDVLRMIIKQLVMTLGPAFLIWLVFLVLTRQNKICGQRYWNSFRIQWTVVQLGRALAADCFFNKKCVRFREVSRNNKWWWLHCSIFPASLLLKDSSPKEPSTRIFSRLQQERTQGHKHQGAGHLHCQWTKKL